MTESETIIPLSRRKLVGLTLGSVVFVAVSIWIWTIPEGEGPLTPPQLKIASVLGIGCFGVCAIHGFIKLFDKKPGLVIDREGIIDNSSGVAAGRIRWIEIIGFQENEIFGQRFLTVQVTDPGRFLNQCGYLKAKLNSANLNRTGSPINISSNSLAIGFDELIDTLARALNSHNKADSGPRD